VSLFALGSLAPCARISTGDDRPMIRYLPAATCVRRGLCSQKFSRYLEVGRFSLDARSPAIHPREQDQLARRLTQ
jgi:hypothetical protein